MLQDKFTDIVKELKDRTSNPFFASFLISWCVCNWRLIFGPILISKEELGFFYAKNYFDYFDKQSRWWLLWAIPIGSALLYTFVWPYVKNLILGFITRVDEVASSKRLIKSGESVVRMQVFIDQNVAYNEKSKKLESVLNSEAQNIEEIKKLNVSISSLQNEKDQLQGKITVWESQQQAKRLDGLWKLTYTNTQSADFKKTFRLEISNHFVNLSGPGIETVAGLVLNFTTNPDGNKIFFVITYGGSFKFYALSFIGEKLVGSENNNNPVELIKASPVEFPKLNPL